MAATPDTSSNDVQTDDSTSAESRKPARRVRRVRVVPPRRNWLVSLAFLAIGLLVWWFDAFGDHAIDKIFLLICTFAAIVTPITWLTFFSGNRGLVRWAPACGLALLMIVPFLVFEIREVGGELIPHWGFRWSKRPDETLSVPDPPGPSEPAAAANLSDTTPDDFPQFLGPGRDLMVTHVRLARDWETNPPQQVWQQPIGAGWSAFAVINGYAVTMEQRGELELVTCYDVLTGELKWSHGVEARYETVLGGVGPRATPTIDEGLVYAQGATGILRCLNGDTGEPVWQKDLRQVLNIPPEVDAGKIVYGRSNSPLVVDNLVIAAGGGTGERVASLIAFDKKTGKEAWRGGPDQISYASPALATLGGVRQVVSVNESTVSGHDLATGRTLWQHPWPGHSNGDASNSQPVPLGGDRIFVSKSYGMGSALLKIEKTPGGDWAAKQLWHDPTRMKTKFTNVVVKDGYVYGLSDGILECIELDTGKRMWKRGRYYHGQILGVGDVLLVISEKRGEVVMVELTPEKHRELGEFEALDSSKVWNNLALYGPYLLVRDAQQAACWKLPLAEGR